MTHLIRALLFCTLTGSVALAGDGDDAKPSESDDRRIAVELLPQVCRDAVLAAWPGSEIRTVERDEKDYEVGIRDAHGHILELRVSETGALLDLERELERERGRELERGGVHPDRSEDHEAPKHEEREEHGEREHESDDD